jgi:hypothetical protein
MNDYDYQDLPADDYQRGYMTVAAYRRISSGAFTVELLRQPAIAIRSDERLV